MANPVIKNTPAFQQRAQMAPPLPGQEQTPYAQPYGGDVMTYDGVLLKSVAYFLLAAASATVVGMFAPFLAFPLFGVAFILSLVVSFGVKRPAPVLYGFVLAAWGGAVGGASAYYEQAFNGIILQALLATATVFAITLGVYKSGRVRNIGKVRKFLAIAVPSLVVFYLINLGVSWFGGVNVLDANLPGSSIPLGLIISLFAIVVGAFMLISDFDFVDNGVRNGAPAVFEWTAAYGLVFAIVWIYIEMLRLLSYLRGR